MDIEKEGKFMQNEKKKNLIIIMLVAIIAVLSTILVLLLTGILNFENDNTNKENNTIENGGNSKNENDEDTTSEYANWMNYLLETNIQEIKVTRIRSAAFGDKEEYTKTITLSVDDLKDFFKEISSYELV